MCMKNSPVIVGGKLRSLGIERPTSSDIIRIATEAVLNGFGLDGDGPVKKVTGSKLTIVVSTHGCSCAAWRNGEFCQHAALYLVETAAVTLPPAPCDRRNGGQPTPAPRRRRPSRYDHRSIARLARDRQDRRRWPVRASVTATSDTDELAA